MLTGFTLFIGYILMALIFLRIYADASPSLIVCLLSLIVYTAGLLIVFLLNIPINFFTFSSVYWCFSLIFLMIFGAAYKSISLRMMLHIYKQSNITESYEALLKDYIQSQSYSNRLKILIDKEMLQKESDLTFNLTAKGHRIAYKIHLLQRLFAIQVSG